MVIRVATDVGGTFTDLVAIHGGGIQTVKADTTPPAFEAGVIDALRKSGLTAADITFFAHGSTVVINALTERKGVTTGLITTAGFRDVIEIGRGNTPDLYNIAYRKPRPFVERRLRRELPERMSYQGEVIEPLDDTDLPAILTDFKAAGVAAIAVCFLHAYANPAHERRVVERIQALWPEVAVIASHHVTLEWREYERTSSTVLSAYILPVARRYIDRLAGRLKAEGVAPSPFIMQSNGGIATVAAAKANPIALVESGPVGGILGGVALGRITGISDLIILDIGGTTAKCSLVHQGEIRITTTYDLERSPTSPGYPLKTPVIDIVEIGNGGGSIAWLDAAGALHVGPESAGSTPGPVAYGRGGSAPTTTDANLLTGRINPQRFVGGTVIPDMTAVEAAFAKLGAPLGRSATEMAHGVLQIANANMVNALKLVSVNRGYDPRDFSLMAVGGGGPLHATALAEELGIPRVIVPPHAAVFSAWGMLMIDLRRDYIRTRILALEPVHAVAIDLQFQELQAAALEAFAADGITADRLRFERFLDTRYRGQEHTVKVPVGGDDTPPDTAAIAERFHRAHKQEYTFRLDAPAEVVNFHLVAYGLVDKPELPTLKGPDQTGQPQATSRRHVDFGAAGAHDTDIYDRAALCPGHIIKGPAVIEEPSTVTVAPPGATVTVDPWGSLHIHLAKGRKPL